MFPQIRQIQRLVVELQEAQVETFAPEDEDGSAGKDDDVDVVATALWCVCE